VVLAALAIGLAFGVAAWLAAWWPQTILLQNIVTMIGLGIGIDYALLLVARFREALPAGAREAAVEAAREAGGTVLLSGAGVAIGFAALLAVPANELRSIAVGGCLVVALSVLLATTLLPGLLAALGTRVKPGRAGGRVWRRWGELVVAHPVAVLVLALLPLVALSLPLRHLSTDIPSGIWLPAHTESARGAAALERLGQAGMAQTLRVVVEMPAGTRVSDERGWREALRVSRAIEADARAARVRSLPLLLKQGERVPPFDIVPPDLLGSYVSRDERLALVDVVPREGLTTRELMRFAHDLRAIGGVKVGGLPAFNADYQHAVGSSVGRVVALIVGGTFVALLIGFRAPLVALKAVALNLVSVAAAMGAAVLVFQDGYGARLFGLAAPLDGLFPAVPIIAFCVVFGLSIDYEVFLVARVHEALRAGAGADEALVDALARTGGVITSAALVMILVFAGFAAGELVIIQILGFTLAAAVLIDATLVRLALGPALLKLGGRWNWWPSLRRPRSRRP
jgi:RND superfamily putative drug exporter